jgi:hypothetical protein
VAPSGARRAPQARKRDPTVSAGGATDIVVPQCGDLLAIIGPGTPPHYASLHCRSCGVFRSWLSRVRCPYLAEVITDAGVPRKPIILSHDNHGIGRDTVQPRPLVSLHQQP